MTADPTPRDPYADLTDGMVRALHAAAAHPDHDVTADRVIRRALVRRLLADWMPGQPGRARLSADGLAAAAGLPPAPPAPVRNPPVARRRTRHSPPPPHKDPDRPHGLASNGRKLVCVCGFTPGGRGTLRQHLADIRRLRISLRKP